MFVESHIFKGTFLNEWNPITYYINYGVNYFTMPWWCHDMETLSASWWRHQMETFPALLAICAGNSPVPGEFPTQKPVKRSFDVFFDLRLNKRLSKQSWGWWFETLSRPLWRHRNDYWPFCEGNISGGFPTERHNNTGCWCFVGKDQQADAQAAQLPVIWNAMSLLCPSNK